MEGLDIFPLGLMPNARIARNDRLRIDDRVILHEAIINVP